MYVYHHLFQKHGLSVELIPAPSGTGDMLRKLEQGEIDIGTTLMEGTVLRAVQHVLDGKDGIRIGGLYTRSPLCWAIAVHPKAPHLSTLSHVRVGISRYGSGSHIMAVLLAQQQQWTSYEWIVCDDIQGLLNGIQEHRIDTFLWEVITTQVRSVDVAVCRPIRTNPRNTDDALARIRLFHPTRGRRRVLSEYPRTNTTVCTRVWRKGNL
jgi:hypothetical protein